ncbi:hypothetical protein FRC07_012660 [Ceratobasidium sp. 392]|nr:hypothetical protein FRC07_012660 [Ceratobasidium sp. 392]
MATHANIEYSTKREEHKDLNYTMIQAFEWYCPGGGVHWNMLKDKVGALSSMGITAMWLPPPTKASGQNSVGYDIYDVWDLGEFDQKGGVRTNYGTKEELVELVRYAHENGKLIYMGFCIIIFGADHTERFLATEVDPSDRNRDITDKYEIEGWTGFDFSGRGGKYSQMKWTHDHFTGVDYNNDGGKNAIFRINGKNWAQGVDSENRNYDYLMGADIDHHHPKVKDDLLAWGKWVIDEIGAAGFRFDAIKVILALRIHYFY